MENNRGDYYDGDKNPSVFLGMNAIENGEQSLCFAFGIKFLQKKQKAFLGIFWINFFWVWEELKLERDGEILGFCFFGLNSIPTLSIVLSRREREKEREREREI